MMLTFSGSLARGALEGFLLEGIILPRIGFWQSFSALITSEHERERNLALIFALKKKSYLQIFCKNLNSFFGVYIASFSKIKDCT